MNAIRRQKAELFDVDGTLCDVRGIRHYVTPPNKDFHAFHMASQFCPPNPEVVQRAREAKAKGKAVLVVTARMARYRTLTRKWLESCEIPYDALRTRREGDFRKDAVIKREILAELRLDFDIDEAHDDNPAVAAVWEEEGIKVNLVPGWDEQFSGLLIPGQGA
jgi:FMN phosphatase YigB (HAD superfamily)